MGAGMGAGVGVGAVVRWAQGYNSWSTDDAVVGWVVGVVTYGTITGLSLVWLLPHPFSSEQKIV
jgi:hypothetical protein